MGKNREPWEVRHTALAPRTESSDSKPDGTLAVLVIEPNEEHQVLSTMALGRRGFRVTIAGTGRDGIRVALSQQFDAVVLDSKLRDMPAFDVLTVLAERRPEVPKIFVITSGQEQTAVRALASGASGYLVKTARYNEILPSEVESQIGAAKARRSLKEQKKALGETEERFQKVFQVSPVAIALSTRGEGRFLDANHAMLRMLGYTREEFIGRQAVALGLLIDDHASAALRQRILNAEPIRDVDVVFRTKTGEARLGKLSVDPIEIEGEPVSLSILRDVTEERRDERLRSSVYEISEATSSAKDVTDLLHSIHRIVSGLMPAENFYIALYDPATDELSFPYFVDEKESAPAPYKPGRGVTEYVLRTGTPLLGSPEVVRELTERGEVDLVGADGIDWLGVPLSVGGRTIGVLAVQSYGPSTRYTETEKAVLSVVSSQVALAIDRKRSDEARRHAEARFHAMIEKSTDGISLLGPDGSITWQSPSALRLFGYPPEETVGQTGVAFVHPDDMARIRPAFTDLLSHPGKTVTAEFRIRHKDGSWRWMEAIGTNLLEDPDLHAVILNYRDITERVLSRQELEVRARQHEAIATLGQKALVEPLLSAFLNAAAEVVATTLHVSYVSILEVLPDAGAVSLRAKVGWNLPLGTRITEVSPDTWVGHALQSSGAVLMADARTESRFRATALLSDRGIVSGIAVPIAGSHGPFGILAVHATEARSFGRDDVYFCEAVASLIANALERRRIEKALSESERLASMGQLAAYVAHEVNTPLTNISLLASSIARRETDPEVLQKLDAIAVQRRRATAIITDLLEVPRLRTARRSPEDVRKVISAAVEQVGPYRRSDVTLNVDLGDHAVFANLDVVQIREVLVNLLKNALQATTSGSVTIHLSELPDFLFITVEDTGVGMAPEVLEQVLRPPSTASAAGASPGLATSRNIVAAHGGTIEATSEVGKGSTFTVMLPRFEAH